MNIAPLGGVARITDVNMAGADNVAEDLEVWDSIADGVGMVAEQ